MKNTSLTKFTAFVLLVSMIAITMVSGTLAKYTTSVSGTGTAIVAKWNVSFKDSEGTTMTSSSTFNLFDVSGVYDLNECDPYDLANATIDVDDDVREGSTATIIAPGTWGKVGFTVVIDTSTEVSVKYEIVFSDETNNGAETTKIPLEFSKDGEHWVSSLASLDVSKTVTQSEIKTAAEGDAANSIDPKATLEEEVTVYWRWLYERTNKDEEDTSLGEQASIPTYTVNAKLVATQVD